MLDLYAVRARREGLLERAAHPRFAAWWPRFLADCRAHLAEDPWPAADGLTARHARAQAAADRAELLAFAAALTGDEAMAARARELLAQVAADPDPWMGPGHKHHYPELDADLLLAERTKRVVAAASWLDPWLTAAEREAAAAALRERGGAVLYRDAQRGAWWAGGYNSNWCAVLQSGLGLAALYLGESDWLAEAVDAIERVLSLSPEGAGIEGIGYWLYCFKSSLDLAEALAAAGDERLLRHPFWAAAIEFPLHLALPDLSGWVNFGDCGYPGLGGSALFYAIAAHTGDGRAQWLANQIAGDSPGWWDFLHGEPDLPETPPDGLAPCRRFADAQLASLRSGWDRDAVHFVLKGGSNAWSHCHLDLNSFVLTAYGERLAVDPGPWPYTPDYWTSVEPPQSTAWHNTLTVDGGDQRQPPRYRLDLDPTAGGDAYCLLSELDDAQDVATVVGDATTAYADTLERFHRHVAYLKPNAFVLYDDVVVREERTQRHLQWLLHAVLPIEDTEGGVVIRGERAALHVHWLLPEPRAWKHLPDRDSKHGAVHAVALRPAWHHLWNTSPTRSQHPHWRPEGQPRLFGPEYPFVVLLEAVRAGEAPRWTGTASVDEAGCRVELTDGGSCREVSFARRGATSPSPCGSAK